MSELTSEKITELCSYKFPCGEIKFACIRAYDLYDVCICGPAGDADICVKRTGCINAAAESLARRHAAQCGPFQYRVEKHEINGLWYYINNDAISGDYYDTAAEALLALGRMLAKEQAGKASRATPTGTLPEHCDIELTDGMANLAVREETALSQYELIDCLAELVRANGIDCVSPPTGNWGEWDNAGVVEVFKQREQLRAALNKTHEKLCKEQRRAKMHYETAMTLSGECERLRARVAELEISSGDPLPFCPITGREFFMHLQHPELGYVATYGGPYDSYTIPVWNREEQEFRSERCDHDEGAWVDGGEPYSVVLVDEGKIVDMEARIAELEAENLRLRDERRWQLVCAYASTGWMDAQQCFDAADAVLTAEQGRGQ